MARPRKPTKLKVLQGTAKPSRTNQREPKPKIGIPPAPEHLSAAARAAWNPVGQLLLDMRVLTLADGLALEGLCETYADLRRARSSLDSRDGLWYEVATKQGGTMYRAYPEVAMVADADRRLASWLTKFGLSPADLSRVHAAADPDKEKAGWDKLA